MSFQHAFPIDPDAFDDIAIEAVVRHLLPHSDFVMPDKAAESRISLGVGTVVYRFYPNLRRREGVPHVVFYMAFNKNNHRTEYAIGPRKMDDFLASGRMFAIAAGNFYGFTGHVSNWEVGSAQVGYFALKGDLVSAIRALGRSWVAALQDPGWWMMAIPSTAAVFPKAGPRVRPPALSGLGAVEAEVAGESAALAGSGIAPKHFEAFKQAAQETQLIGVVRNGKPSAVPLIEAGCPGKPKIFEPFNTNPENGILTATTEADKQLVLKSQYILINENGAAVRRLPNGTLETVKLEQPFWKVEPGQVIDPKSLKPVVGDYDLMGVISPENPGQNITLHSVDGKPVANRTSPQVDKFSASVNEKFDQPRVLHGAQDQYKGFRKGATVFHPGGKVEFLPTEADVQAFYKRMGRETIQGSYPRPGPGDPVPPDELAARRAARKKP